MVQAGMTPSQVIVAATSRAAEYLRLADRGLLAPGKRADLLVLDGNPLRRYPHPTPAGSPSSISPVPRSIAPPSRLRLMKGCEELIATL